MAPPAVSMPSTADINSVFLELLTTGDDNWTESAGFEEFNFTIHNTNSSLELSEINISVPLAGDGNGSFAVNISTITFTDGMWNCTNASTDGLGNTSVIRCNTSSGNEITDGSTISILFCSTASSTSGEDAHQWTVGLGNATAVSYSLNLSSGTDGMPPRLSGLAANDTYFNGDILIWATVTDATLDNSTVDISIVNAGNSSQVLANPSGESCLPTTGYSQNCSVSWSPSSQGNYSFNVSVDDKYGASNSSTYSGWFLYDSTNPTIQMQSNSTPDGFNLTLDHINASVIANDTHLDTITIFLCNSTSVVNKTMSTSSPFFQNFTGLPNDFYYLNATVNDSAGNTASTATRTIVLDDTPPTIVIHTPANISYGSGSSLPLSFSAGDNVGLSTCQYSINGTANSSLTGCANTTITVGAGNHNITIYVEDTTGNLNSATRYFTVDLGSPIVTLIEPRYGWDDDGDGVYFYYRPADAESGIKNCSLWLSDNSGVGWSLSKTNTSILSNQANNFSVSGLSENSTLGYGNYLWNVECYDNASRPAFATGNYSVLIGDRSNIMVQSITPDETITPYVGLVLDVEVNISNNGTANVANTTNVTFCFGTNSANPCEAATRIYYNTSEIIPAANLQVGENHSITYTVNITGSGGDYYFKVSVDPSNYEEEQYDGTSPLASINDNIKIVKTSTNLNVTIVSVTEYISSSRPKPGDNVTVNVSVLYGNGSAVTGLVLENFTIADRWMNDTGRNWMGMTSNTTFYEVDFTQNGAGIYIFNYTIPQKIGHETFSSYERAYSEYGLHYFRITANENNTGHNLHGTSGNTDGSYYMIAPYLRVSINSFSMDPGDPKTYKTFTVYNDGSANFTAQIDLTIARTPTSGMIVGLDDPNISVSEISDDMYQTMTNNAWFNPSAENTYTVRLNASTTFDGTKYYYLRKLSIDVENTSDDVGDDDGDDQQQAAYECTTNASCSSTKWCDGGECVTRNCPSGYYASNHICKVSSVYDVDITKYPRAVYVLQGGTADTNITVENSGNQDLTMMLEVETDADGVEVATYPESLKLLVDKTSNFSAHFEVDENTTIGNYSSKFMITTSSTAKDTVSFTLVIQPLAETIVKIKADYENYMSIVEHLLAQFDTIKLSGFVAGENLTLLEAKVNATRLVFDNAKSAMANEDYIQVDSLLDELGTLVNQTMTLMDKLGVASVTGASEFWNTVILWLVVGIVCIGAVGLLIYMLVPPQGYAMGRGYGAAGRGNVLDKARNMLNMVKCKVVGIRGVGGSGGVPSAPGFMRRCPPAYKSGYKKLGTGYKPETTGIKDKMKNMIKKK